MERMKHRLLELLFEHSFRYSPDAPFTLSSGRTSPYYLDCKKTLAIPEGLCLVGELFFQRIRALEGERGIRIDAVGGLVLGAVPIADAVAYQSYLEGHPIFAFAVRKEPKKHGMQRWVEGFERPGARVVIVEDVVTTGDSTLKAIEGASQAKFQIEQVLVLVDRQEGGRQAIEERGYPFSALFTTEDFLGLYHRRSPPRTDPSP